MLEDSILKAIEKEIKKSNNEFFNYAWREKLNEWGEFLEEESRYSKLVKWIDKEINICLSLKNVFSPADKHEETTVAMVNKYKELMQRVAILVDCREKLLDNRTTTKMRENIDYTICKLFKIRYNTHLGEYIQ